jgi:hypothetical protein
MPKARLHGSRQGETTWVLPRELLLISDNNFHFRFVVGLIRILLKRVRYLMRELQGAILSNAVTEASGNMTFGWAFPSQSLNSKCIC